MGKSAAILLGTLGKVLPLMQLPQMREFVQQMPTRLSALPNAVQTELCGALLTVMLVPVGPPNTINWDERFHQVKAIFTEALFAPYLNVVRSPTFYESGTYKDPQGMR